PSAAARTGTATWGSGIPTRRSAGWTSRWTGWKTWKNVERLRHAKASHRTVGTHHERAPGRRQQGTPVHGCRVGWQDLQPGGRAEGQTGRARVLSGKQHPRLKPSTLRRARRDGQVPKSGDPTVRRQPRRRQEPRELRPEAPLQFSAAL